jgi:hypothetical protein
MADHLTLTATVKLPRWKCRLLAALMWAINKTIASIRNDVTVA